MAFSFLKPSSGFSALRIINSNILTVACKTLHKLVLSDFLLFSTSVSRLPSIPPICQIFPTLGALCFLFSLPVKFSHRSSHASFLQIFTGSLSNITSSKRSSLPKSSQRWALIPHLSHLPFFLHSSYDNLRLPSLFNPLFTACHPCHNLPGWKLYGAEAWSTFFTPVIPEHE